MVAIATAPRAAGVPSDTFAGGDLYPVPALPDGWRWGQPIPGPAPQFLARSLGHVLTFAGGAYWLALAVGPVADPVALVPVAGLTIDGWIDCRGFRRDVPVIWAAAAACVVAACLVRPGDRDLALAARDHARRALAQERAEVAAYNARGAL